MRTATFCSFVLGEWMDKWASVCWMSTSSFALLNKHVVFEPLDHETTQLTRIITAAIRMCSSLLSRSPISSERSSRWTESSVEQDDSQTTTYFHSFSMIFLEKIRYFSFICIDSPFLSLPLIFFFDGRARSINIDRVQKTSIDCCSQTFDEAALDASLDGLECLDIQHTDHHRLFSFLFVSKGLSSLVDTRTVNIDQVRRKDNVSGVQTNNCSNLLKAVLKNVSLIRL